MIRAHGNQEPTSVLRVVFHPSFRQWVRLNSAEPLPSKMDYSKFGYHSRCHSSSRSKIVILEVSLIGRLRTRSHVGHHGFVTL